MRRLGAFHCGAPVHGHDIPCCLGSHGPHETVEECRVPRGASEVGRSATQIIDGYGGSTPGQKCFCRGTETSLGSAMQCSAALSILSFQQLPHSLVLVLAAISSSSLIDCTTLYTRFCFLRVSLVPRRSLGCFVNSICTCFRFTCGRLDSSVEGPL